MWVGIHTHEQAHTCSHTPAHRQAASLWQIRILGALCRNVYSSPGLASIGSFVFPCVVQLVLCVFILWIVLSSASSLFWIIKAFTLVILNFISFFVWLHRWSLLTQEPWTFSLKVFVSLLIKNRSWIILKFIFYVGKNMETWTQKIFLSQQCGIFCTISISLDPSRISLHKRLLFSE